MARPSIPHSLVPYSVAHGREPGFSAGGVDRRDVSAGNLTPFVDPAYQPIGVGLAQMRPRIMDGGGVAIYIAAPVSRFAR